MIYSQGNIEKVLDRLLSNPDFFLEVGCWSGEHFSQTAWLEHEQGWTGLCVDPFPVNFENRPHSLLCAKAVSLDGLPREFIQVSIDRRHGGDVSYLSGFMDTMSALHWDMIQEFCDYRKVTIETITFEQLSTLYKLPEWIGFLSVDTEGSELGVFRGIDFNKQRFGVITFEHNFDWNKRGAIARILSDNNYILYEEWEYDDIWVNRDL